MVPLRVAEWARLTTRIVPLGMVLGAILASAGVVYATTGSGISTTTIVQGNFDDIDVKKALSAEKSMRDYVQGKYADLVGRMEEKKDLAADDEKALKAAVEDWKKNGSF